jgi:hypothetical protein
MADRRTYEYKGKRYSLDASLTPEEAKAKIQDSLLQSSSVSPPDSPTEYEEGNLGRLRDAAREFIGGATLEWGDEVGIGLAAAIAAAEDDRDFLDALPAIYDDMKETYEYQRDRFKEDSPVLSTAANLAGAVLAPVKGPSAGASAGRRIAQAAAESGVAGAGIAEGDLVDVLIQGGSDALTGAAFQGVLSGAGKLARQYSKREIAEDLLNKETGEFTPITEFADPDSKIDRLYNTVKRSFPGNYLMSRQYEPILQRSRRALESAEEGARAADDLVAATLPKARSAVRDEATDIAGRGLRKEFVEDSIPNVLERTDPRLANKIRSASPEDAMARLDDWWAENGFSDIKGMAFQLDDDGADKLVKRIFKSVDDPALRGRSKTNDLRESIEGMIDEDLDAVPGDMLMELRNQYAMGANKASGLNSAAQRKVANVIDDFMRKQLGELSPDLVDEFDDQLGRWRTMQVLRNAQTKAVRAGSPDVITPRQALQSARGSQVRRGQQPLYAETKDAQRAIDEALDKSDRAREFIPQQPAVAEARRILPEAREAAAAIEKMKPPKFQPMEGVFSTSALGRPANTVGNVLGYTGGPLVAGALRSARRGSKAGQIASAGQSRMQTLYASLLKSGYTESQAADMVKRAMVRESVAGE